MSSFWREVADPERVEEVSALLYQFLCIEFDCRLAHCQPFRMVLIRSLSSSAGNKLRPLEFVPVQIPRKGGQAARQKASLSERKLFPAPDV